MYKLFYNFIAIHEIICIHIHNCSQVKTHTDNRKICDDIHMHQIMGIVKLYCYLEFFPRNISKRRTDEWVPKDKNSAFFSM